MSDQLEVDENTSDGYHTFRELYRYRMLYNAAFFNMLARHTNIPVVKSHRHGDGEPCFGGGWFIVMAQLPTGQVSNHYEDRHWDLFDVPEAEMAPEWDGHTPNDAADRLESFLEMREPASDRSNPSGNAAVLREALENARSKFAHIKKCADEGEVSRKKLAILCEFVSQEIAAALAAPPRNCDVGTAEEQAERFEQFCLDNHSAEHLCSRCPLGKQLGNNVDVCQLHWAQMPYATAQAKKGETNND